MTVRRDKILVSACLIGRCVRYTGTLLPYNSPELERWQKQDRVIACCPEVAGGLPVPRPPCEIRGGTGRNVLSGNASVISKEKQDVTSAFVSGAFKALDLARKFKVRLAILKEGSPSCGSTYIYDGSFTGTRTPGSGVTAALLLANDILLFNEHEVQKMDRYFK